MVYTSSRPVIPNLRHAPEYPGKKFEDFSTSHWRESSHHSWGSLVQLRQGERVRSLAADADPVEDPYES